MLTFFERETEFEKKKKAIKKKSLILILLTMKPNKIWAERLTIYSSPSTMT